MRRMGGRGVRLRKIFFVEKGFAAKLTGTSSRPLMGRDVILCCQFDVTTISTQGGG
mgnify:CR=1 FL=1